MSAFFFAFYMVPQKLVVIETPAYLWVMSIGVLITTAIPWAATGFQSSGSWVERGEGLLCGVGWMLGTLAFAAGIKRLGLALATPIKNITGVLGTLVGLILFQEWRNTNPLLCTIGSMLIVTAAIIIGQTGKAKTSTRASAAGIIFALLAAVAYASYLVPMKQALKVIGVYPFAPWMALGMVGMATVILLTQRGGVRLVAGYAPRVYFISLLGGACWAIAFLTMAQSVTYVGLSIAWALCNLNTVPAVFLGILAFHEISFREQWPKITVGLLAATVGTLLLGLSKG
ncbi:MAG: GRP family sugar transporter [bacterium]